MFKVFASSGGSATRTTKEVENSKLNPFKKVKNFFGTLGKKVNPLPFKR